jgi:hypothetical protein
MILQICRWALWLDEWLQARLGRPYNVVLGIGLVSEIIDQVLRLGPRLHSAPTVLRVIPILAVEFALLLHQLGSLAHHMDRRRGGRGGHPVAEPATESAAKSADQ